MNESNLEEHYNRLFEDAIEKIGSDTYQTDDLIDSPTDKRFGITLLIRPDDQVKNNIHEFLNEVKALEPDQYYYPDSDIHITVMSIISCYDGFSLNNILVSNYADLIRRSMGVVESLKIEFKGITASPSCVMIRGFPNNNSLNTIRNNLRTHFRNSGLQQSMDQRYSIQAAHSTVVRFRKELRNKEGFINLLEKYRDHDFGTSKVSGLELVYNDWYMREKCVKVLYRFSITE